MPDAALSMRMRLFSKMLTEGRKIRVSLHTQTMLDLCQVATVAGNVENLKSRLEIFQKRVAPERSLRKAMPMESPQTAAIVNAAMQSALRFMKPGAMHGRR